MNDNTHHLFDLGAFSLTLAALIGWIPAATTILSFVYICVRLYETKTVRVTLERVRTWLSG